MLSIDEARAAIFAAAVPLAAEDVAVLDALGRVLAEDVAAGHDVPPFANSAMDGFAVRAQDGGMARRVTGESRAGRPAETRVGPGEAFRISTGAMVPDGADAIVPVERTRVAGGPDATDRPREPGAAGALAAGALAAGGTIAIDGAVLAGAHVRYPGEDLRAGSVVLRAGTRLGPAELAVAVGAGRGAVRCASVPRVAIVGTGDELVSPGAALGPGQIHESNTIALAALAARDGARVVSRRLSPDDAAATRDALTAALVSADVVLVSGGVSVGPHDHVKPALDELGVAERFWRVALRPGKPTWFGTRAAALVFGLPGNPVSALVTYALFARPALAALQGAAPPRRRRATLAEPFPRNAAREEAVRVHIDDDGRAHATGRQGSHIMSSMLGADGLALIPRGEGDLPAGTSVEVEPLAAL